MNAFIKQCQRVLMTTDPIGGVWPYTLELAEALQAINIEVILASMGRPLTEIQRREVRAVPGLSLIESSYRLEWMDDPWSDVAAAGEWLFELVERFQPDLLHLNGYAHAALPWNIPVLVVGHSCVYSWFEAVKHHRPPESWQTYRRAVQGGLVVADAVTAPSEEMMSALQRHYGPFRSVPAIPNARRHGRFCGMLKEPFVFSAGRLWDDAKNIAALSKCAPKVAWPIYVAGDHQRPDGTPVSFQGIRALGALSSNRLAEWCGRAAIYAAPALYEPFGLSILEAALSHCALVLSDIPSLREIWGDTALFVPADDSREIAKALQSLIDRPADREKLAEKSHRRAREFTPQKMADSYAALYAKLMARRPTSAAVTQTS